MAPLGRIITFNFQKSSFWSGFGAGAISASRRLQLGWRWGTVLDSSLPWIIWSSSPPPPILDCDRIWVASFLLGAFTSVFKNSLIKSRFVLTSSQFTTVENVLSHWRMRLDGWGMDKERQEGEGESWKPAKPDFTYFRVGQEDSPESRMFFWALREWEQALESGDLELLSVIWSQFREPASVSLSLQ